MYSWCTQLLHMGEVGEFLWESPTETLAEYHWHYRRRICMLVTVKQNMQFCRKKKWRSTQRLTSCREVSITIAFHARNSKKNRVLSHMDSVALSSKCIWKKSDLNQFFQAKPQVFQRIDFLSCHIETGSPHCCRTRFNRSKILSSTSRRGLGWFSQVH